MKRLATAVLAVSLLLAAMTAIGVSAASPGTVSFTEAMLQFNPANATKGDVNAGDNVVQDLVDHPAQLLFEFCWPGNTNVGLLLMTVSSDGTFSGECAEGGDPATAPEGVLPRVLSTTLAGSFDPATNTVSFVMDGTYEQYASFEGHPLSFTTSVTVVATGVPVVGNSAIGMVDFSYACVPANDSGTCGIITATGTVEARMLFFPFVPTATGVPTAPPTPTPSPSPSSGPLSVTVACSADLRNVNCTATPEGAGDGSDLTYAWTFNGSPQAGTGSSFQYDFIEAQVDNGTYPVSVTLTDNADGRTASTSTTVELGTFASVAESNPNLIVLLLVLAGAGAAIIGAFWLWLRGRAPKPNFAALGSAPIDAVEPASFAVGSDRAGGFEDSLEYGDGAGMATPASSKAYEALVVASSRQAAADEPLVNPEGEVAESAREDEQDDSRTRDRGVRETKEGR